MESGSNTQILAHTKVQQSDLMLVRMCLGSLYVEHESDFYLFCALEYPPELIEQTRKFVMIVKKNKNAVSNYERIKYD